MCRKLIYLVCGVVVLITAAGVPAGADEPITVENYSFEEPNAGKQKCWDGETGSYVDVPGWTDGPNEVAGDSGVESLDTSKQRNVPSDGDWSGFLKSSDPCVYNLTNHVIGIGDVYELNFDAGGTSDDTVDFQYALYYDDNGARVILVEPNSLIPDRSSQDKLPYSTSFTASDDPNCYNHRIGIQFDNLTNGSWVGFDYVRLTLKSPIKRAINPNPAHMATVATTDVMLSWRAGDTADKHRVYIGDNYNDVENGTGGTDKGLVDPNNYLAQNLVNDKTYYWRIDEVESGGSPIHTGVVWEFTVASKKATNPAPADNAKVVDPNVTLSWAAGVGAVNHDVYLGTSWTDVNAGSGGTYKDTCDVNYYDPSPSGILDYNTTYYWRIDEVNMAEEPNTYKGDVWNFKTEPNIPITDPCLVGWFNFDADEDDIAIDWSGYGYHGQIKGDPNYVAGHEGGKAIDFDGVDDYVATTRMVQDDFTLMAWISTDTNGAGEIDETAREGSGLIWSGAAGATSNFFLLALLDTRLAFRIGTANVTSNGDVVTGDWVHVAVTRTRSSGEVAIFINGSVDNTATMGTSSLTDNPAIVIGTNLLDKWYYTGLIDEVQIYNKALTEEEIWALTSPPTASMPQPSYGDTDVERNPTLTWRPGKYAASHLVYVSDDEQKVIDRSGCDVNGDSTAEPYYPIATILDSQQTYYWAIDEVNGTETWKATSPWHFTTGNHLVLENFDTYADEEELIGNDEPAVWHDYDHDGIVALLELNTDANFAYGDSNSMAYNYDNEYMPQYSEAWADTCDLPYPITNWTAGGIKALMLHFYGQAGNDANEQMYVKLTDGDGAPHTAKVDYDGDMNDIKSPDEHEWNIKLSEFSGVNLANVARITIGFGDGSSTGDGDVYFDEIRLYSPRCILSERSADFAKADYAPAGDPSGDCIIDYQEIEIMGRQWLVADYNSDPLIAWYKLDGDANDSSAYNNDGSVHGDPNWGTAGKINTAADLNGVSDYIDCGNNVSLDITNAITLAAWVKTDDSNNGEDNPYVMKGNQTYGLKHRDSNEIEVFIYDDAWYYARYAVDSSFNGAWHHLAGTYDGSQLKFYVDSVLETTADHVGSIATDTYNVNIGRNSQYTDRLYEGLIDDVRIYDKALSQTEIDSIYNGGAGTDGLGSVSHYHPVPSVAELYDSEAQGSRAVNFKDFAVLANIWLTEDLWP
jgi:hypothetical protein